MTTTIKFYDRNYNGGDLKMAILAGYTFSASHKNWSDVSSYEIGVTGDYPSGGVSVDSSYANHQLTITDFSLNLVTAQNVTHLVLYVPATNKLVLAVEFDTAQNFNNTYLVLDWPQYINLYQSLECVIRIYNARAIGPNLKMAILSGYTFDPSHRLWSQVADYDIGNTGQYQAGGIPVSSTYVNNNLSIQDHDLYLVTAQNVKHLVLVNSDNNKLLLTAEYLEPKNWNNSKVLFNWPEFLDIPVTEKKKFYIEMEI